MKPIQTFLDQRQSLEQFYTELATETQQNVAISAETFTRFTHDLLIQPAQWFKAFTILEKAVEAGFDVQTTEDFLIRLFKGYDFHAAFDLNEEDYKFFWKKINQLLTKFASNSSRALIELALQHYGPRRNYRDYTKLLTLLEEAVDRGSENAKIYLGYYLYMGFCDKTDKERGLELLDSVTIPKYKQKATVYKNFMLLSEDKYEEAMKTLNELVEEDVDPDLKVIMDEQKAIILQRENKLQEANEIHTTILNNHCSPVSAMYLGFYHYNNGNQQEGLQLMELASRYGRPEIARSLFRCYFQSGHEWEDNERGIYWIEKGHQYYDPSSTYQLAYLYLFYGEYKDLEKGLYYLDKAIEMNYPEALSCKGYMYYEGDIIERDIEKSVEFYSRSMKLGNGYAAYRLGVIHEEGLLNNNEPDYETALSYYETAAELDNIYGLELSGRYNLVGVGCEENVEKALQYYHKGAEMGSSYCKVELAFMYQDGNGVEQDSEKTFELIKDAADNDYAYAYYLAGRCYRYGVGVEENPDEAIRYIQMAADAEVSKGQTELALCYEEGYGVEVDGKKAFEYMLKAAEQEYPFAQYKVGCYYLYGIEGTNIDYQESFKWMSKAAEAEFPHALLEVGDYYLWDYGNANEKEKAYPYYMKAAEQGYVNEGLGICYEYGIGVEENKAEAFKHYLQGAEDGNSRAMYNVGRCYYHGYGIKVNMNEAFRWFNDASNDEIISAMYYKGKMLLDGEGCTQDMDEGINFLTKAADNDFANAQYVLANCYLIGNGVEVDEEKAMELFEAAADNGHEDAAKVTGRRKRR